MKKLLLLILLTPLFAIQSACAELVLVNDPAPSDSATLSWAPPTTRTDGSPLSPDEIMGYEIAYAQKELPGQNVIPVPAGETSYTFESLSPGTNQYAVRTVDSGNLRADWSDIVEKVISAKPGGVGAVTLE